jgi:hypothetical protein
MSEIEITIVGFQPTRTVNSDSRAFGEAIKINACHHQTGATAASYARQSDCHWLAVRILIGIDISGLSLSTMSNITTGAIDGFS